jgi:hypothetical protein
MGWLTAVLVYWFSPVVLMTLFKYLKKLENDVLYFDFARICYCRLYPLVLPGAFLKPQNI